MTTTKIALGAAVLAKECGMVQLASTVTALALSLLKKMRMTAMTLTNWPFPQHPPVPWTVKQIKEYAQQQRQQLPEAPLCFLN
jgi:hypothetical protein